MRSILLVLPALCLSVCSAKADQKISQPASAPIMLQDGEYQGRGDYCRVLISNDSVHQTLQYEQIGTGTNSCDFEGQTSVFYRISDTEFTTKGPVSVIDQNIISQCTPTTSNPQPCDEHFYDAQNGSLLLQVGDQGYMGTPIQLKNTDSYELEDQQAVVLRGNNVLLKWDEPVASSDPGSYPAPMLYVKISQ
jgi:hypothetical protein